MVRTMFYLVSLLLVAGLASASRGRSIDVKGGLGAVKPIDDEAREAFSAVKDAVAATFHLDAATLTPEEYAKQTVAGTMFFIRIRITTRTVDNYIHAKVLRDIQGHFTLKGTKDADTNEKLVFF